MAEQPDHIWCAVLHEHVDIVRDTLQATVTTSVRAFSAEHMAQLWAKGQDKTWSIVQVRLDPPIE